MLVGTLEDACGEEPGNVCEWVYDRTDGNETLAKLADWLVGRPLEILVVVVIAGVAAKLGKRWVRRVVQRFVVDDGIATRQMRKLGLTPPAILAEVKDPRREVRAKAITTVLGSVVSLTVWTIAMISILGTLGIDLGPLLAGAGVAGIAIGFGAQSLVKDWITGIFMLIEDQYGIGDVIDVGPASGVVERFALRTTVLRAADGTVWHVPNGEILRVGNRSQIWSVAVVDVLVAYDSDLDRARTLLLEATEEVCARADFAAHVLEPPQVLGVESVTAEGVTLRVTVKTTPGGQWDLQRAIREAVKAAFDRGGIAVPISISAMWARAGTPGGGAAVGGGAGPSTTGGPADAPGTSSHPTGDPAT
jgi:moderate conductance mechanosensitive channel